MFEKIGRFAIEHPFINGSIIGFFIGMVIILNTTCMYFDNGKVIFEQDFLGVETVATYDKWYYHGENQFIECEISKEDLYYKFK